MVRGNWQKRVEKAHDRRKEARQKKVRKENRALYKALVQNQLWPLLDKFSYETIVISDASDRDVDRGQGARVEKLHLWVDQRPASRNRSVSDKNSNGHGLASEGDDYLDDDEDSFKKSKKRELKKGKGKNASTSSGTDGGKKKRAYEKGSPSVKKIHPRSHENAEDDNAVEDEPLLCRKYFYCGQCEGLRGGFGAGSGGKSKKNSNSSKCTHVHYSTKRHLTLAQSLAPIPARNQRQRNDSTNAADASISNVGPIVPCYDDKTRQAVLQKASDAAAIAQLKLENVDINGGEVPEDSSSELLKDLGGIDMLHYLEIPLTVSPIEEGEEDVNVTDLVAKALAADELPIASIAYVVFKKLLIFDRFDVGKMLDSDAEDALLGIGIGETGGMKSCIVTGTGAGLVQNFPGIVLEHILMFLPDQYSGLLTFVCKNFHREIGTSSPWLWKSLLQRHNWPMPSENDAMMPAQTYISPTQYQKQCFISHYKVCRRIDGLVHGTRSLLGSCESANAEDNVNEKKDTAVYSFRKNQDKSSPADCNNLKVWGDNRVLASSPEDCTLHLYEVSKQEDSTNIIKEVLCTRIAPLPNSKKNRCYLESMDMDDRYIICSFKIGNRSMLTSIKREDLLSNSTEDFIECDGGDLHEIDLTINLMEHASELFTLENDLLEIEDVAARLEGEIHASGNGIFVAIVGLHLNLNQATSMRLGTILLSFTAAKGRAIVDFVRLPGGMNDEKTLLRTNFQYKKRNDPTVVLCKDLESGTFFFLNVDRRGKFTTKYIVEDTVSEDRSSDVQMTCSHLSTMHLVPTGDDDETTHQHLYISILPMDSITQGSDLNDADISKISVDKACKRFYSMRCLDDEYVMLIFTTQTGLDIDAHWFGEENENKDLLNFVLLHIPSQREIHRSSLIFDMHEDDELLFDSNVSSSHLTISGFIDDVGLFLSGENLLHMTHSEVSEVKDKTPKNKKSKKKKRLAAKIGSGGKKDGFARGMSMRG